MVITELKYNIQICILPTTAMHVIGLYTLL